MAFRYLKLRPEQQNKHWHDAHMNLQATNFIKQFSD